MNTALGSEPTIAAMEITEDSIIAQLTDGRTISVPLGQGLSIIQGMLPPKPGLPLGERHGGATPRQCLVYQPAGVG